MAAKLEIHTVILIPGKEHPKNGFTPVIRSCYENQINVFPFDPSFEALLAQDLQPEDSIRIKDQAELRKKVEAARILGDGSKTRSQVTLLTTTNALDLALTVSGQVEVDHLIAVSPPDEIRYSEGDQIPQTIYFLTANTLDHPLPVLPTANVIFFRGSGDRSVYENTNGILKSRVLSEIVASPRLYLLRPK